jgi:ribose 5-phosphate isomerase B
MRIALAADHNGVAMKKHLAAWLTSSGHVVDDRGVHGESTVDYPPLCVAICAEVVGGRADRAIMIGGAGGGEVIACNKIHGIRAGLGHSVQLATISAGNNNTNVLILGAKVITPDDAVEITRAWLTTPFKGGEHQRRLDMIATIERGEPLQGPDLP